MQLMFSLTVLYFHCLTLVRFEHKNIMTAVFLRVSD